MRERSVLEPVRARWRRLPTWVTRYAVPLAILAVLALYPQWYPENVSWMPTVGTAVIICVFVMMALGLNIVVGYAGLLDLGYVAFYAAGAYVAGWFASQHFTDQFPKGLDIGGVDVPKDLSGIHISPFIL